MMVNSEQCFHIFTTMFQDWALEQQADGNRPQLVELETKSTEHSQGRVRYVAAMCLYKQKKKQKAICLNNVFKKNHNQNYLKAKNALQAIAVVEAEYNDLCNSSKANTLRETERKQYDTGHLTHVTDKCYSIFSDMNAFVASTLNIENLRHHQANLLNVIVQCIHAKFYTVWLEQFDANEHDYAMQLLRAMTKTFVKVMAKQFFKDTKPQKQKAHRTQVLLPSKNTWKPSTACQASNKRTASMTDQVPSQQPSPVSAQGSRFDAETDCAVCREERDGEWVQCNKCSHWYHCDCIGMSRALFNRVKRYKKKKWHCESCDE